MHSFLKRPAFIASLFVIGVLFVAFPLLALAQAIASTADPTQLVDQLLQAVQGRNWLVVAGSVLAGVVYVLRTWGGNLVPALKTDRGGAVLALAVGILGALATTLASSKGHVSLQTLIDGLYLGFTTAGGYAVLRKITFPADKVPAAPATPATPAAAPKGSGFATQTALMMIGLVATLFLLLSGCTTLSALSGSTGPIPITQGKDLNGNVVTTSTVTVTAAPVKGNPPACIKPVSVSFDTLSGVSNQCNVEIPVPPVGGVCQRFEPACFCW